MYGPELFLFMCRMGAAAVGCRMDAVLFEDASKIIFPPDCAASGDPERTRRIPPPGW